MENYLDKLKDQKWRQQLSEQITKVLYFFLALEICFAVLFHIKIREFIQERRESFLAPTVAAKTYTEKETIQQNLQLLQGLNENNWYKLSLQEKLDILQTVANIEANHLQIPFKVILRASKSLPENVNSGYNHENHLILLNLEALKDNSPIDMLLSITHEMRHCHQQLRIDKYLALSPEEQELLKHEPEAIMAAETEHYPHIVFSEQQYEDYVLQYCEIEARKYSWYAILDYLEATGQLEY